MNDFIDSNHAVFAPVQAVLKARFTAKNYDVNSLIRQQVEEIRNLEKHLENLGVSVYGNQQLHLQQEAQSKSIELKFAKVSAQSKKTLESIGSVEQISENQFLAMESMDLALSELRTELSRGLETVSELESESERLSSRLLIVRRSSSKVNADLLKSDQERDKIDHVILGLEEEILRMEKDIARQRTKQSSQLMSQQEVVQILSESVDEMSYEENERKKVQQSLKSNEFFLKRRTQILTETLRIVHESIGNETRLEMDKIDFGKKILEQEIIAQKLTADFFSQVSVKTTKFATKIKATEARLCALDCSEVVNRIKIELETNKCLEKRILEISKLKNEREFGTVLREINQVKNQIYEIGLNNRFSVELRNLVCERKKIEDFQTMRKEEEKKISNEYDRVSSCCLDWEAKNAKLKSEIARRNSELVDWETVRKFLTAANKESRRVEQAKRGNLEKIRRKISQKETANLERELADQSSQLSLSLEGKIRLAEKSIETVLGNCEKTEKKLQLLQAEKVAVDELKIRLEVKEMELVVFVEQGKRKSALISHMKQQIAKLNRETNRLKADLEKIHAMTRIVDRKMAQLKLLENRVVPETNIEQLIVGNDKLEEEIKKLIAGQELALRDRNVLEEQIENEKLCLVSPLKKDESMQVRVNQLKQQLCGLNKQKELSGKNLIRLVDKRGHLEKKRSSLSTCSTSSSMSLSNWSKQLAKENTKGEISKFLQQIQGQGIIQKDFDDCMQKMIIISMQTAWSTELVQKQGSLLKEQLLSIEIALDSPKNIITKQLRVWNYSLISLLQR